MLTNENNSPEVIVPLSKLKGILDIKERPWIPDNRMHLSRAKDYNKAWLIASLIGFITGFSAATVIILLTR